MPPRPRTYVTKLDAEHPLVGTIWNVSERRASDDATLLAAARSARFVYLGEKHDNPDHHRLQAWVLASLVAAGRKPSLAMEQFDVEQQPAIDEARRVDPKEADAIATMTHWSDTGWPPWEQYAPIVRVAVEADLPIFAANLSRARGKALVRGGPDAMAPDERARLGLDKPVDPAIAASIRAELDDVHCGMPMPSTVLDGMAFAARARDAVMAERVIAADKGDGVAFVAGSGHTRTDRGVPAVVAARGKTDARLSVAFVEVAHGVTDPAAYAGGWHADALPFDFVIFTPRLNDDDPCAGMREPAKTGPVEGQGGTKT